MSTQRATFSFFALIAAGSVLFAPAARAAFDLDLYFGISGSPAVTELQQFLREQGVYDGPVTGNFLSLTQKGVRAFQMREGISPAAGYFGPKTRARARELDRTGLAAQLQKLQALLAELQRQTMAAAQASSSSASAPAPATASPEALINARSIVGLDCFFSGPDKQLSEARGSGVIISPDGTILTVRHLVDLKFSASVDPNSVPDYTAQNFTLDHCDAGQVPAGSVLPSGDVIRSLNPFIPVPGLFYRAGLSYLPRDTGQSANEASHLDFALLKISGLSDAGRMATGVSLPVSFDYSPLESSGDLVRGTQVLTYGFPGDVTRGLGQQFSQLYMLGGVGRIKEVYGGDRVFLNQPFVINTEMEVRSGRSGSPLFLNGKVIGIVTSHSADNVTDSFSVSSAAIYRLISGLVPNL